MNQIKVLYLSHTCTVYYNGTVCTSIKKLFCMASQFADIPKFQDAILQLAIFESSVAHHYCFYMEVGTSP